MQTVAMRTAAPAGRFLAAPLASRPSAARLVLAVKKVAIRAQVRRSAPQRDRQPRAIFLYCQVVRSARARADHG